LDAATQEGLLLAAPPCAAYTVTTNDLTRLQPLSRTWLGKSQQTALDYETILELVAEKGHSHPNLIRQLNPSVDWTNVTAGTTVRLPDVACADASPKAAFVTISLAGKMLEAFDANTNLLAHFPCSIAQRVEKRPVGELHVAVIAPNPNYTFDPDVFPESAEARQLGRKLILPPGPNNPVGVAWIGLDKPGYGIHGTPSPEQVGRTESHGCFRLANWNAECLLRLAWIGMPVYVEP
jgi:lipoprotein-anchoring transpeptidase ErfK/SrfK